MREEFEVNGVDVRNPRFDEARRVHDWRNYVGERTRSIWGGLSDQHKIAIARDADDRAGNEDWE